MFISCDHVPDVKLFFNAATSLSTHPGTCFGRRPTPGQGIGQQGGIAGWNEDACFPVADDLRIPPTLVATTGSPVAIASKRVNESPSVILDKTNNRA
jgi:hypothetical protein